MTVVRRIRYRFDTQGWRGNAHTHLFVVDVESGDTRQITDGDWDDHMPAWSPDGERIAFVSDRSEDRDLTNRREVYVAPASGGEPEEWSQGLVSMLAATWSPDGRRLAALGTDDPRIILPWHARLFVLEPGKPPRPITDGAVSPVGGFPPAPTPDVRWTDDDGVLFLGDSRGETFLYRADASMAARRGGSGAAARRPATCPSTPRRAGPSSSPFRRTRPGTCTRSTSLRGRPSKSPATTKNTSRNARRAGWRSSPLTAAAWR